MNGTSAVNGNNGQHAAATSTHSVKSGLAQMLKGGVIMDVVKYVIWNL
jgi:hypothetical protein